MGLFKQSGGGQGDASDESAHESGKDKGKDKGGDKDKEKEREKAEKQREKEREKEQKKQKRLSKSRPASGRSSPLPFGIGAASTGTSTGPVADGGTAEGSVGKATATTTTTTTGSPTDTKHNVVSPVLSTSASTGSPALLSRNLQWFGINKLSGIEECLRMFTAVEILEGENKVGCRRCWKIENGVWQQEEEERRAKREKKEAERRVRRERKRVERRKGLDIHGVSGVRGAVDLGAQNSAWESEDDSEEDESSSSSSCDSSSSESESEVVDEGSQGVEKQVTQPTLKKTVPTRPPTIQIPALVKRSQSLIPTSHSSPSVSTVYSEDPDDYPPLHHHHHHHHHHPHGGLSIASSHPLSLGLIIGSNSSVASLPNEVGLLSPRVQHSLLPTGDSPEGSSSSSSYSSSPASSPSSSPAPSPGQSRASSPVPGPDQSVEANQIKPAPQQQQWPVPIVTSPPPRSSSLPQPGQPVSYNSIDNISIEVAQPSPSNTSRLQAPFNLPNPKTATRAPGGYDRDGRRRGTYPGQGVNSKNPLEARPLFVPPGISQGFSSGLGGGTPFAPFTAPADSMSFTQSSISSVLGDVGAQPVRDQVQGNERREWERRKQTFDGSLNPTPADAATAASWAKPDLTSITMPVRATGINSAATTTTVPSSVPAKVSTPTKRQPTPKPPKPVLMQPAYKRYLISIPPPVLVIHLKRFQQTSPSMASRAASSIMPMAMSFSHGFRKLDDYVTFPEYLDLGPYLAPKREEFGLGKKGKKERDRREKEEEQETLKTKGVKKEKKEKKEKKKKDEAEKGRDICMYRLYGVVVHIGNMVCAFLFFLRLCLLRLSCVLFYCSCKAWWPLCGIHCPPK